MICIGGGSFIMSNNMNDNFCLLKSRVLDSVFQSDLDGIKKSLAMIREATITSGVGGSYVVSTFLSKVLSAKNNIICENVTPRDLLHKNITGFKNVIACSYSGNNFGVDTSFHNHLNKYLLSSRKKENVRNLHYKVSDYEDSFISLVATLLPMTILLLYYSDDFSFVKEILELPMEETIYHSDIYEILSGYESSTAANFLESTMVEAGIGIPIIHDKYDFCHGRSTLGYSYPSSIILFDCKNTLDRKYQEDLKTCYKKITTITKKFDDDIVNDYYFTYMSMLLCQKVAEQKKKDLSEVRYSPLVKKLYYYKGEM